MKIFLSIVGGLTFIVALLWAILIIAEANNSGATLIALSILISALFILNTPDFE